MHSSKPLLRPLTNSIHQTRSRIPHLEFHIHARLKTRVGTLPTASAIIVVPNSKHASSSRNTHTTSVATNAIGAGADSSLPYAHWRRVRFQDEELETSVSSSEKPLAATAHDTLVPKNIYDFLLDGDPERLFFALQDNDIGGSFIRGADNTAFLQALEMLDPYHFLEPLKPLYKSLDPRLEKDEETTRYVKPLADRFRSFLRVMDQMVALRRTSGYSLTLEMYQHLLRCLKVVGYPDMVKHILLKMMPEDGVKPDLACYNYAMEAAAWSRAFNSEEAFHLQVTEYNLKVRAQLKRPKGWNGYRVADSQGDPNGTLRHDALMKFKDLAMAGHEGDEATFINLMTAMGREGDMVGVNSVLKSVWNIDVDLLGSYDEEEVESPTFYDEKSPLRPTDDLLYVVVHIFCTNNQVGTANMLLDYISRNYNLPISLRVWEHLLEWAVIHAIRRSASQLAAGQGVGKIHPRLIDKIWSTMIDEPHRIQPTAFLYVLRARIKRDVGNYADTIESLRGAIQVLWAKTKVLQTIYEDMVEKVQDAKSNAREGEFFSTTFLNTRRDFIQISLEVERDFQLVTKAVRQFLRFRHWPHGLLRPWWLEILPSAVQELAEFLPGTLMYPILTGKIELDTFSHGVAALRQHDDNLIRQAGLLRKCLDVDSHEELVKGVFTFSAEKARAEKFCHTCRTTYHTNADCPVDAKTAVAQFVTIGKVDV